jgi:hypothetical protein
VALRIVGPNSQLGLQVLAYQVLGFLFTVSSLCHLFFPTEFLEAVYAYDFLSAKVGVWFAWFLPPLEFSIGICLLKQVYCTQALASCVVLLGSFLVAQLSVVVKGNDTDCGCFGPVSHPVGTVSIMFILLLLSISCYCALCVRRKIFLQD